MNPASSNYLSDSTQHAIIFSDTLIRHLEGPMRLPTTYIGVRQVRPAGGTQVKEFGQKKNRYTPEVCENPSDIDDDWSPNMIDGDLNGEDVPKRVDAEMETIVTIKRDMIAFKVTNSDGTTRRMTSQEKKKLKYEMKQAKHLERKEQKQIEVKERIRVDKEQKRRRKLLKRLAKKTKTAFDSEQPESQIKYGQVVNSSYANHIAVQSTAKDYPDDENEKKYRGEPPVILTPAATQVAMDLGVMHFTRTTDACITELDDNLSKQWAEKIQDSMVPIENLRAKEDIRQMPYKLIPEVWTRLRQVQMEKPNSTIDEKIAKNRHESDYSMTTIRSSSQSYDDSAYLIFRHMHKYFNLHLACGAKFGCDYLLYDGQREEKHSFAGLRIYSATDGEEGHKFPLPSAYDLHGFVRAMNTARKLALIATVVRSNANPRMGRIAIVDLALEAVLTAPVHIKKGNTDKRRGIESTGELVKKKY